jgi:hypothetical protein
VGEQAGVGTYRAGLMLASARFSSARLRATPLLWRCRPVGEPISNDGMIWLLAALRWKLAAYERGREHTDAVRTPHTS